MFRRYDVLGKAFFGRQRKPRPWLVHGVGILLTNGLAEIGCSSLEAEYGGDEYVEGVGPAHMSSRSTLYRRSNQHLVQRLSDHEDLDSLLFGNLLCGF